MAIDFVKKYASLVRAGLSIDKVPEKYRGKVKEALDQTGGAADDHG